MTTEFNNPYIEGGDSFVLLYNKKYYLYCTGDTENSYDAEDLSGVTKIYDDILIQAEEPWETIQGDIAEGPFVLKRNGLYYLSYSCNDVTCKDYAVGYAVAKSPLGPFEKYKHNPILIGKDKLRGVGRHSFVYDKDGDLICVHHCHNPYGEKLVPRRICFRKTEFKKSPNINNDILYIH